MDAVSINPGFEAQEQRRSQVQATNENSSRYASCFVSYVTTGWGEFLSPDVRRFTTTFIRRPSVSHGISLDGDALEKGRYPRVTAGVHKWLQDENGFYIGAWLFFVVETMGVQFQPTYVMQTPADGGVGTINIKLDDAGHLLPDPDYTITHDFTFTGVALKAIPSHSLVELQ